MTHILIDNSITFYSKSEPKIFIFLDYLQSVHKINNSLYSNYYFALMNKYKYKNKDISRENDNYLIYKWKLAQVHKEMGCDIFLKRFFGF